MNCSRSRPLLHSSSPASGVVVESVKRTATGGHKVELKYNLSAQGGCVPLPDGPFQKVYIQTCRFKRGFLKSWTATAGGPGGGAGGGAGGGGGLIPISEVIRQLSVPGESGGGSSLNLMVSLEGEDDKGSDISNFIKGFYEPLETHILDVAKKRCETWFRKNLAPEVIESHFTSALKPSSDPSKFARLMKFNIPFRYGKLECDVFDGERKSVSLTDFADNIKNSEVVLIMEIPHVWFVSKSFGISPIVRAIQFFPEDKLSGYSFVSNPADPTPNANANKAQKRSLLGGPHSVDYQQDDGGCTSDQQQQQQCVTDFKDIASFL